MSDWGTKAFAAKPLTKKHQRQAGAAEKFERDFEEIFDGDYEVCYMHFLALPCAICAVEDRSGDALA